VSFVVPPDTTALTASTQALSPGGQPLAGAAFDFLLNGGDPDIGSTVSDAATGTSTATLGVNPTLPQVAEGKWLLTPALEGPFTTAATVPTETATATVVADTLGFDPSVTGSTGDFWLQSVDSGTPAAGLSLAPGDDDLTATDDTRAAFARAAARDAAARHTEADAQGRDRGALHGAHAQHARRVTAPAAQGHVRDRRPRPLPRVGDCDGPRRARRLTYAHGDDRRRLADGRRGTDRDRRPEAHGARDHAAA
jgi:hypothetical protein